MLNRTAISVRVCVIGFLLLSTVASDVSAKSEAGGGLGALFRFGYGTRALGIGGSVVSLAQDPSSILWNPAGSARTARYTVETGLTVLPSDRRLQFLGFSHRVDNRVGWGISWLVAGIDDIPGYDNNGEPVTAPEFSEQQFTFSFGYKIQSWLSVGISAKHYRHRLDDLKSIGWGMDFGAIISPASGLQIGLTVRDVGAELIWERDSDAPSANVVDTYPGITAAGVSYRFSIVPALVAVDLEQVDGEGTYISSGISYSPIPMVMLRGGIRRVALDRGVYDPSPTGGITVKPLLGRRRISIDYSLTTDTFGTVHSAGLLYGF